MKIANNPSSQEWETLIKRPAGYNSAREAIVKEILGAVRDKGDAALKAYTLQFDNLELKSIKVGEQEFNEAASLSQSLIYAIETAIRNVKHYHEGQQPKEYSIATAPGLNCRRLFRPVEKVGLYIPGGNTPLISTLIMLAVPAKLAGVEKIVICTPPRSDGTIDPAILYAARKLGLTDIYKAGGAQAIGAMAFGTETIPAVYKIFGPGNAYVASAKAQVAAEYGIAIDLPAGPSEVLVLADDSADPDFIAADLLSQAEHGPDSQVGLITWDKSLAEKVSGAVQAQLAVLPRRDIAEKSLMQSFLVTVDNAETAIKLANDYASEHLIIAAKAPEQFVTQIKNAGSVFLGNYTPESLGDYMAGPNHVLPTNRAARAYSGVSVESFGKYISVQSADERGLQTLGPAIIALAETEKLQAHANAVSIRLDKLKGQPAATHRCGQIIRQTRETNCQIAIDLDGCGQNHISTGLGFFDHMLQQIAVHGLIDLFVDVRGDLHIDAHHMIEDTGLALGSAFDQALADRKGMRRYGFIVPMDETRAEVLIDFSGRPVFTWNVKFAGERIGEFPTEMAGHFFKSFSDNARCTLHVTANGENDHHIIEGIFKAFAKALRAAIERDVRNAQIASSKGVI